MELGNSIKTLIIAILGLVIIVTLIASSMPAITTAFTNLSGTGIGFASFFAAGGIVYLIIGAVVLLLVIGLLFALVGHKKR
jgi:hypothetical protein